MRRFFLPYLLSFMLLGSFSSAQAADDAELGLLGLAAEESAAPVAATPLARPTSKIAENVTVITSEEIARLNAHTLADVLNTVPGINVDVTRTPGSFTFFSVQGAASTQVLVLMDSVPLNDFNQNQIAPGDIPVQQIERIEIIKGAASAAWGPALGGVVNIVTKSPEPSRAVAGRVSVSAAEKATSHINGELSGTVGDLGYYLSAGQLHSKGLLTNNGVNNGSLYGKLLYTLPSRGVLTVGYFLTDLQRGTEEIYEPAWEQTVHDNDKLTHGYGFANFSQPLAERLQLDLTGYFSRQKIQTIWGHLEEGTAVEDNHFYSRETSRGLKASLTWGDSDTNLVTGVEYERNTATQRDKLTDDPPFYDYVWERQALFANGTVSLGRFTILPGIRYDHTGVNGDYLSYTLGATCRLTDTTLLRAYAAKGYSLANPTYINDLQETRTLQVGVESSAIPYLWLKGTLFYNHLDGVEYTNDGTVHNQLKQGFELEGRSLPLHGLSLSAGYTYLYATDRDTKEQLETNGGQAVPPHTLKLGLNYDNRELGLSGRLQGNYVWWHTASYAAAQYSAMVWDLHLNWKLLPQSERSPELFFSGHNLFNGSQFIDYWYENSHRWAEVGLRFTF